MYIPFVFSCTIHAIEFSNANQTGKLLQILSLEPHVDAFVELMIETSLGLF